MGAQGPGELMGKKQPKIQTVADDPYLVAKFDSDRNGGLRPEDVPLQNTKPFWWRCVKGGTVRWSATIAAFKRSGCPICMSNSGYPGGGMSHDIDMPV